jgi:hypothetical protein
MAQRSMKELHMADKPTPEETALWQRRLASRAHKRAGTRAEATSRTPEEDEEMLQAAHAAMYFWNIAGNEKHRAHAAQLVAHAYALLGLAGPAAHYLRKSQPILLSDKAELWELAFAHAIASNVAAASKDDDAHRLHYDKAVDLASALGPEDRRMLEATLRILPKP